MLIWLVIARMNNVKDFGHTSTITCIHNRGLAGGLLTELSARFVTLIALTGIDSFLLYVANDHALYLRPRLAILCH